MNSPAPAPLFGPFRLRVDPWEADYGGQTQLEPGGDGGEGREESVELDPEVPEARWRAVLPSGEPGGAAAPPSGRVVFVDGVRRLEARLHSREGERLIYGAFGSYAAGAVVLAGGRASFGAVKVFRAVVLGSGERLPGAVEVHPDLAYVPASAEGAEPDAPLRWIQAAMRRAEAALARECESESESERGRARARDRGRERERDTESGGKRESGRKRAIERGKESLVIVDGPLSFEAARPGRALGLIKRLHELYLPGRFLPLLAGLPAGARTPLFVIRGAKPSSGLARYAWFQRLAKPPPGASDLHGLVRLEVAEAAGLEAAVELADRAASWLPTLAPARAQDPRAPQNLLPVGALEHRLRARLGDARLIRRWIDTVVARESWSESERESESESESERGRA